MSPKKIDANTAAVAKTTETADMKTYRFCCGNWTSGPSGFIARVRAHTPEEAQEPLRRVPPARRRSTRCGY